MKAFKRFAVVALLVATSAQAQNTGGVVGGLIGGALGSQFGQGNGRVASAVVGALAGQYVGQRVSEQPRQSSYQSNYQYQNNDATYRQPVQQQRMIVSQARPVQRDTYRREAYDDNEYNYENDRRQYRQPRERQRRYEKYTYTVVTERGQRLTMVGCAAFDERENAWRQTDNRQCEGQYYDND